MSRLENGILPTVLETADLWGGRAARTLCRLRSSSRCVSDKCDVLRGAAAISDASWTKGNDTRHVTLQAAESGAIKSYAVNWPLGN